VLPASNHVYHGRHIPCPMLPNPIRYNVATCSQYNTRKSTVYKAHRFYICTNKHHRVGKRLVERKYRNQRLHSGKNKTNGKDTKGVKNGQACEASHRKSTYYNTKPSFFSIKLSKLFKNPKPYQNNSWYQLQTKSFLLQR
jgi:hypothetical protein